MAPLTRTVPTLIALIALTLAAPSSTAQCNGVGQLALTSGSLQDFYGEAVTVSGNWAAASSLWVDFFPDEEQGIVDIWRHGPSGWALHDQIQPYDIPGVTTFGRQVVSSGGDLIAFGGRDAPPGQPWNGTEKVIVLRRTGTVWDIDAVLTTPNPGQLTQFGAALDVSGNRLVVGAREVAGNQGGEGRVYVYAHDTGAGWQLVQTLQASTPLAFARFGSALALSGDDLVVTAPGENAPGNTAGAAYVLDGSFGPFVPVTRLSPGLVSGAPQGTYGETVDVAGNTIVVGRPEQTGSASDAGGVYLYKRGSGTWPLVQVIDSADDDLSGQFGAAVQVGSGRLLVGAPGANSGESGVVYVYNDEGASWILEQTLAPCQANAGDAFGLSLSFSGTHLLVGAPLDDSDSGQQGLSYGVLHAFEDQGASWDIVSEHMLGAELSASRGGHVTLHLWPGSTTASQSYVVLGSLTGTSPGVVLKGVPVPLSFDAYFDFLLTFPGAPTWTGFQGGFGSSFPTLAQLTVPAGLPPSFVGLAMHHAWIKIEGGQVLSASEAETVLFDL